jgi:RNase P subunit RPR2
MKHPSCPKCRKPLLIKIVPRPDFYAPFNLCFIGICEVCGDEIGIMYSFNEGLGIEREKNVTNPQMKVEH